MMLAALVQGVALAVVLDRVHAAGAPSALVLARAAALGRVRIAARSGPVTTVRPTAPCRVRALVRQRTTALSRARAR